MDKKTYCAFPFNSFFLCSNGDVKVCCSSRLELGNVNNQEIEEIMHGPIATDIRRKILNNEWHMENCGLCYEQENNYSGYSERVGGDNQLYWESHRGINDENYFKLQRFDLRWSNTCQLACNYCFDYFSSRWANINGVKINGNKSLSEQKVIDFIEKNKENINHINLLGGEPLLQKQNKYVFQLLPDVRYYILTNLSVDVPNNANAQKLLTMPNVEWGVSFETIGDKFEYVRDGAKWETFISNIDYVNERAKQKVNSHSLWCTYNALDLMEFADFIAESGKIENVYWQAMSSHPALSVFQQTKEFKLAALQELDRVIDKHKDVKALRIEVLITMREQLKASINQNEDALQIVDAFHSWVSDLEKKLPKDKSMQELWPDVYLLYDR